MSEASPTRSAVLELKDERSAMHEGYVFLDEKCLLLSGEILRQLQRHAALRLDLERCQASALAALQDAVARHGMNGLQVLPATALGTAHVQRQGSSLMGVKLQAAVLAGHGAEADGSVDDSPESAACRRAHQALLAAAVPLAAVTGNLERLSIEYKRSVRRARALQDVMLPELDRTIDDFEGRLQELEQEDAIWMRRGAAGAR
jgi:V/A-type H+-transporting ATPase subunit D